jgi:hypothetical protein
MRMMGLRVPAAAQVVMELMYLSMYSVYVHIDMYDCLFVCMCVCVCTYDTYTDIYLHIYIIHSRGGCRCQEQSPSSKLA